MPVHKYPVISSLICLARNVSNTKDIDDEVESLIPAASQDRGGRIKKWLTTTLRKYLLNTYEGVVEVEPSDITQFAPDWMRKAADAGDLVRFQMHHSFRSKLQHVVDFFRASPDLRIERMSVPEAIKQSDDWTKKLTKDKSGEEGSIKIIHKYPDGFTWVQLLDQTALTREGNLMGHCVGSYCPRLEDGTDIYSLRDPKNEPHATIEITDSIVEQIKGKGNRAVVDKYSRYILDFVNSEYVDLGVVNPYELSNANMTIVNNKYYHVNDLPDNLDVKGVLELTETSVDHLPKGLHVSESLRIAHTNIKELPSGLNVGGDLNAMATMLTELPDDIIVGGNIGLARSLIKKLPDGLTQVNGHLTLSSTPLTELPAGLVVEGTLSVDDTWITKLPADLKVGMDLFAPSSRITELSEGLDVGGDLDLRYAKITSLPKDIKVGGAIDLGGSTIKELPAGLKVAKGLVLRQSDILELPDGLTVGAGLSLENTQLTKLPAGLKVGGSLILTGTEIGSLPSDLQVAGSIHANDILWLKHLNDELPDHLRDKLKYV